MSDLPGRVVNPYHPPEPGSDDPHQGADLAELKPGTQIAQAGLPVHFVLDGSVAAVIHDRFPYGNAVLIETDLKDVAPNLGLAFPDPLPAPLQQTVLTCPPVTLPADFAQRPRSLYLLYAHLQEYETLAVRDRVTCGQTLGKIGSSGNAMNPHLHLEARIGPAGMTFDSMAHYDVSASEVEMGNYCLWRVSGWFQHIDPMCLLENCGKEGQ